MEYLTVMLGRVSPLGVEVDAVVVRVISLLNLTANANDHKWRQAHTMDDGG